VIVAVGVTEGDGAGPALGETLGVTVTDGVGVGVGGLAEFDVELEIVLYEITRAGGCVTVTVILIILDSGIRNSLRVFYVSRLIA
jgi:hypothetical protein